MAQLQYRLVDEAESVQAPLGKLAAVRVQWKLAVERNAPTTIQPVLGLAEAAETQGLKPRHAMNLTEPDGTTDNGRFIERSGKIDLSVVPPASPVRLSEKTYAATG